ncbi:hypothetical protein LTS18_010770, partial [Coniosporium uncinatum]
ATEAQDGAHDHRITQEVPLDSHRLVVWTDILAGQAEVLLRLKIVVSDEAAMIIVRECDHRHHAGMVVVDVIEAWIDILDVVDRLTVIEVPHQGGRRTTCLCLDGDPRKFQKFRSLNFVAFVESSFKQRQIRCDVLLLSPRLNEAAVVKRQIIEGVQAVCKLDRMSQQTGQVTLQIFNRSEGADRVTFDEYPPIPPNAAVELVLRARTTHQLPPTHQYGNTQASYGLPPAQYGLPPLQQQQLPPPQQPMSVTDPNIQNILSSLGGNDLQRVLGALQHHNPSAIPPQHQPQAQQAAQLLPSGITPDLARILGSANMNAGPSAPPQQHHQQQQQSYGYAQQQQQQQQQPPTPQSANSNSNAYSGLASILQQASQAPQQGQQVGAKSTASGMAMGQGQQGQQGQGHQGQAQGQGQPDMAMIMAQLAQYKR